MVRRIVAGLLIPTLTGCTTFGPVAAPTDFITVNRPSEVWVTRGDSSRVAVSRPRFLGDTLIGFVSGRYQQIPLSDVRQVQARRAAPRRTLLLIGSGLAVVGVLVLLAEASGENQSLPDTDLPTMGVLRP